MKIAERKTSLVILFTLFGLAVLSVSAGTKIVNALKSLPVRSETQLSTEAPEPGGVRGNLNAKLMEFDWINKQLIGPKAFGKESCGFCGCPGDKSVDCPPWYTPEAIQESSDFMDRVPETISFTHMQLKHRAQEALLECESAAILNRGGWCLQANPSPDAFVEYKNISFSVPKFHVGPSKRIVTELSDMIQKEGIKSINDFGAGVGQYKAALLEKHPDLIYNAYDGAGNIVNYTKGFTEYFDLTYPLGLAKADWVLSLEVGEHVPSRYEGMLIRNLHRHNCKGIILSWGVLGQRGHGHINNHSNEYLKSLMERLGYMADIEMAAKLRNPKDNYRWFQGSVIVFRRNEPVC